MRNGALQSLSLLLSALVLVQGVTMARAGCLVRPEQYRLQSDTVHWSISLAAGTQCLQGLRGNTIVLEDVSIVDQPTTGNLTVVGPSFRYLANRAQGTDSFRLMLTGTSLHVRGYSYVTVDVTIQ
jgi:hypothetical protein